MKRLLFGASCLLLAFILFGCGDAVTITSITVSPTPVSVGPSGTQQFTATAYDATGRSFTANATWSVQGDIGAINSKGLFTAGTTLGAGYVVATSSGISGQSTVTISNNGTISGTIKNLDAETLSSITVTATNLAYSHVTTTDTSGKYSFTDVPTGEYRMNTTENITYLSATKEVTIVAAQTTTVDFTILKRLTIDSENLTGLPNLVIGSVKNNGKSTVTGITVTYLFYESDGSLAGGGASGAIGSLAAGASSSFSISLLPGVNSYATKTVTITATSY